MNAAEARQYPRHALQAEVEFPGGAGAPHAVLTDISRSGMFIRTEAPLWVGASFTARVRVEPPLLLDCVVRRVLPGRGMGVAFQALSDQAAGGLQRLLATLPGA